SSLPPRPWSAFSTAALRADPPSTDGTKGLLVEGGSARKAAVEKALQGLGGKLDAIYYAYGDIDVIVIAEVPDAVSALALSLTVNASGAVNIRTTPLLTVAEVD